MTNGEAFLQAIIDSPSDEGLRLVYADWLEEHDDPRRAELLRLHCRLLATCCEPDEYPERAGWQARVVEFLGQGVRTWVPQRTVVLGEGVEMVFSLIPPGTFLMGSPPDEEGRDQVEAKHRVTLTKGFWLGTHPVTQGQWQTVTGSNPSGFKGDDRPVERVFWDDCVAFCTRLGEETGHRFRLATEAEWEYACRAGTTTAFYTGGGLDAMKRAGWCSYDGNWGSAKETKAVGQFEPNAWGLFDTHGNVWEWVADCFGDYPHNDVKDPLNGEPGTARVLRGGGWCNGSRTCRSAYRTLYGPGKRVNGIGCRVCLCLDFQGP